MSDMRLGTVLRRYGSVHFDLDGVLLDSNDLKVRCMIDAIASLGPQVVEPFVAEFRRSFGRSRFEHFRRLYCHHLGGDELGWEEFYAVYGGAYGALVRARYADAPLCAHAASLVRRLAAAGMPMTVVTGTPTAEAIAVLESHGLAGAFTAIFGGEQPKPVRIGEALAATDSERDDAIFVGDSLADLQAANQRRVQFVFVGRYSLDPDVVQIAALRSEQVLVVRDLDPAGEPEVVGGPVSPLRLVRRPAVADLAVAA